MHKSKIGPYIFSVTFAPNPAWVISQLKQIDKNMFLIASSKSWDSETIHKMLKAGAKDYIMQPFNTYVLKRRIENYLKIIRSAKMFEYGIKPINAFAKPCLPYYTTFKISHEHDLTYFWEHLNTVHINSCTGFSECYVNIAVNAIFNIGTALLKEQSSFTIFLEHNYENYYFTIADISEIAKKGIIGQTLSEKLAKHSESIKFLIKNSILSLETPYAIESQHKVKENLDDIFITHNLKVFDFIDSEDLHEINECLNELESSLSILQYSDLKRSEVGMISSIIKRISSILSNYNETYNISIALKSLSENIEEFSENFMAKSKDLSIIFITFCQDLKEWKSALFETGAPNFYFMDATIITNTSYIASFINNTSSSEDISLDDIFEFAC